MFADLQGECGAALPGLSVRWTLFGSRVRGDAEPASDLDVLVEHDLERLDLVIEAPYPTAGWRSFLAEEAPQCFSWMKAWDVTSASGDSRRRCRPFTRPGLMNAVV
jgi:hypothetical protein